MQNEPFKSKLEKAIEDAEREYEVEQPEPLPQAPRRDEIQQTEREKHRGKLVAGSKRSEAELEEMFQDFRLKRGHKYSFTVKHRYLLVRCLYTGLFLAATGTILAMGWYISKAFKSVGDNQVKSHYQRLNEELGRDYNNQAEKPKP